MIYDRIVTEIASSDLSLFLRKAEKQTVPGEVAYFCPFCRMSKVGKSDFIYNENKDGSDTPHFIVFEEQYGGLYHDELSNIHGCQKWMCTRTHQIGYGALELYAAIHHLSLEGDNLRKCMLGVLRTSLRSKYTAESVEEHIKKNYQWLLEYDYRTIATQPTDKFLLNIRADFTPQELKSLGCDVSCDKNGTVHFSWDRNSNWQTSDINKDFRVYSLERCVLPSVNRNGKAVSEIIYGTPINPLFVCFATDDVGEKACGCVFRPAMQNKPMVFSNDDEHSVAKISKWLAGDRVYLYASEHRETNNTAVVKSLSLYSQNEIVNDKRIEWRENVDGKNVVMEQVECDIPENERKVQNVIFCHSPQDAISTYYSLRALRQSYEKEDFADSPIATHCWYHVTFLLGHSNFFYNNHGEWENSSVEFSTLHHRKLTRFADKVIILFPNTIKLQYIANSIVRRFRDINLAVLPDSFRLSNHQKQAWLFSHPVSSVRDFLLCYRMTDAESFQYDRDFYKMFYTIVKTALPSAPLKRVEKRDRRGFVRSIYYQIDTATLFTFLRCEGYGRDVDGESENKIGRFVKVDGCFVDILDDKSMVSEAKARLIDYAKINAPDGEFDLMVQAINSNKDININTITQLPVIPLTFDKAYGKNFDYLYFRNGALLVTPDEIRMINYKDIDFHIDRRAKLDYDYNLPQSFPFSIKENPEAEGRRIIINEKAIEKNEEGNPKYSLREINTLKSEYLEWERKYSWYIDWKGKKETEMQPALRVVRGFANMKWEKEEELIREGATLTADEQSVLNSNFANILFCIGRMLWRFRSSRSNSAMYLMENSVIDNKQAQGGSGKSTLLNIIVACAAKVKSVDCKRIKDDNIRFALADFIPNVHRVIHWEDTPKSFPLDVLYNFISGETATEKKFGDVVSIRKNQSPGHAISSNYPMRNIDDSTLRRFCMIPFSDRFCGENAMQNRMARTITDVLPGFTTDVDQLPISIKRDFVTICALALQFVIKYDKIVQAPLEDVKQRQMSEVLSEQFMQFADYFFSRDAVFCSFIDMRDAMRMYIRDFADSSEARKDSFRLDTFKKRVESYCRFKNITFNPPHLFVNIKDIKDKCFHLHAWKTTEYFVGPAWEGDDTISPKFIRHLERSDNVYMFFRHNDQVPTDYEEVKKIYNIFKQMPDPIPYLDENGEPQKLTEVEALRWKDYNERRQGKKISWSPMNSETKNEITVNKEELPF